ncbi:uncharacterized protein LTR77_010992 [Saxophila tyrrhenica]|uniref:Uncharacterized protein n=1 Tax=Saxophila tyrrhenica TaxID=1690608 RepID=A0AAV9NTV9_9PEZI|nr:hypothetical protein LTR77_010992 [Saxophila tyrrhenica]
MRRRPMCGHRRQGRDGLPHEKADPAQVQRLRNILTPPDDKQEIWRRHREDKTTKWFGVVRDPAGRPYLEDYGRYASLRMTRLKVAGRQQSPQLVSFIGVTNAGKSSLISMLIQHESVHHEDHFPSPVVGSTTHDSVPTSGDVHLYLDPLRSNDDRPIMYADCEGFEGGEKPPMGSQEHIRISQGHGDDDLDAYRRPIRWANRDDFRQREYAVTALYPRLLYTFSDCVVFVLRNPKTFQSSVLTRLLEWGATAMERSINQPTLPHCVIVLNGSDPALPPEEWDVGTARRSLLSTLDGALDRVPRFRELAALWRARGYHVETAEELILRYYGSFQVVRVPLHPHYGVMDEQIAKLRALVHEACERSWLAKWAANLDLDADEWHTYLQSGFDHFTAHIDIPFDLMQTSLMRNPIPSNFSDHVLQLCKALSAPSETPKRKTVTRTFDRMAKMVASCVMMYCVRSKKGRFFHQSLGDVPNGLRRAIDIYRERYSRCLYRSPDGTRACMLMRAGHSAKGHQDLLGVIAPGDHQAVLGENFGLSWTAQIEATLTEFSEVCTKARIDSLGGRERTEEQTALQLHKSNTKDFFDDVGSDVTSHVTCFACLMDTPEHILPCGHVLCTACVGAWGHAYRCSVAIDFCPVHSDYVDPVAIFPVKPAGAGVRILALEGGGVRGVIQLEFFAAIERAMGNHMAVQKFFDLIVGTGTGGLVATILSAEGQSVQEGRNTFIAICERAYGKKQHMLSGWLLGSTTKSQYAAEPLYEATKEAFADALFFGSPGHFSPGSRVAIPCVSEGRDQTVVLANYRRAPDDTTPYTLHRPHGPETELKVWECVCAGMANTTHFKPFSSGDHLLVEVGVTELFKFAKREARATWPDREEPDIFLSISTEGRSARSSTPTHGSQFSNLERLLSPYLRHAHGKVCEGKAAQAACQEDRSERRVRRQRENGDWEMRLHVPLDESLPPADSVADCESLRDTVRKRLQQPYLLAAVQRVASYLLATYFYLHVESDVSDRSPGSAYIACRRDDGHPETMKLGKILREKWTRDFSPYFCSPALRDEQGEPFKFDLSHDILTHMAQHGELAPNKVPLDRLLRGEESVSVYLVLSPKGDRKFPISGMPYVIRPRAWKPDHFNETDQPVRDGYGHSRTSSHSSVATGPPHRQTVFDSPGESHRSRLSSSSSMWSRSRPSRHSTTGPEDVRRSEENIGHVDDTSVEMTPGAADERGQRSSLTNARSCQRHRRPDPASGSRSARRHSAVEGEALPPREPTRAETSRPWRGGGLHAFSLADEHASQRASVREIEGDIRIGLDDAIDRAINEFGAPPTTR